jgi:short-subunit dehydrogenase involved in D-alanine esterification of teichoic acids
MKIAITGHTAGIGQALAEIYSSNGHEIVGLSRRNGYNIRSITKVASMIEPCDIFINNAQVGFAQTELLFAVYKLWQQQPNKKIINISTMLTSLPASSLPGIEMTEYYVQKKSLEEAVSQLKNFGAGPKICLVKPGAVATQPGQTAPMPYADVNEWATQLMTILDSGPNLEVSEISLGVNYG